MTTALQRLHISEKNTFKQSLAQCKLCTSSQQCSCVNSMDADWSAMYTSMWCEMTQIIFNLFSNTAHKSLFTIPWWQIHPLKIMTLSWYHHILWVKRLAVHQLWVQWPVFRTLGGCCCHQKRCSQSWSWSTSLAPWPGWSGACWWRHCSNNCTMERPLWQTHSPGK